MVVTAPQGGGSCFAVGTGETSSSVVGSLFVWPTGRSVHSVGSVEEATRVTEVVASAVSAP